MPDGYLRIYKNDGFREETGYFEFDWEEGFTYWSDHQNDNLSSFRYELPFGWELRIHLHRDPGSQYHSWRGTGQEEFIDKDQIPDWLHDQASGHSWAEL